MYGERRPIGHSLVRAGDALAPAARHDLEVANEDAHQAESDFDALVSAKSVASDRGRGDVARTIVPLVETWGAAALTALFAALGGFTTSLAISDAREFGWPATRPSDELAQMSLDESLLGLPLFGAPTALLVAIFVTVSFFTARSHRIAGWLLPSALVVGAAVAPIIWAFTI